MDVRKVFFTYIAGTGSMDWGFFYGMQLGKSVCCVGKVIMFLIIGSKGGKNCVVRLRPLSFCVVENKRKR